VKAGASGGFARHVDSLGPWVALGLLGSILGLGVRSTNALVDNTAWVDHTHRVIETLDELMTDVSGAMNARRAYSLTGDAKQMDNYAQAARDLAEANHRVRVLTADNPAQQYRLDQLGPLLARRLASLSAALEYRRSNGFDANREATTTRDGIVPHGELVQRVADLAAEERRLLTERERRMMDSVVHTKTMEMLGAGLSVVLISAVLLRLRREIARRAQSERAVRASEQAIQRLNDGLERRIDERTTQLRMANAELESFSYSVVHDLRAPLRGMGGFAEILLNECSDSLSDEAQECLREIHQNARKMAALIDGLVSMSRVMRWEVSRTDVDLTALARSVAAQLATVESRPGLALVVHDGLRVAVDAPLGRRLVEILLGNAWKFTARVAQARIEVGGTELNGERVLFVRDNGAGFDMEHVEKLFAPFGRLHADREFPGLGVGLATAKRIVQRHEGRIWADGRVGEGAAFYFTLGTNVGERIA
jgi:signal transduction histidine kinase